MTTGTTGGMWMTRRASRLLLCMALSAAASAGFPDRVYAQSQAIDGTIEGVIRGDAKLLPGAKVRAVSVGTGYERDGVTDASGRYSLTLLPPGEYVVVAEMTGFGPVTQPNLVIRAGQVLTVEFDLSSTQFTESVQVTARSATVEVARTVVSNTYDQRVVRSIPTIGRSIMDFFTLQPGVNARPLSTGGSGTGTPTTTYGGMGFRQINVDGVSNNLQGGARNVVISQEAVEEFQTVTNFSAEFGRVAGGLQNVITRSGSNQPHGSAFLFTRQKFLSASPFLLPAGAPAPDFARYNYGFTSSGAVTKDRTFYFVSYERWRQDQPAVSTITPQNAQTLGIPSESIGAFNTSFRAHTLTARGDVQLSRNNRLSARYNYYYDRESPLGGGLSSVDVASRFDENPYSYTVQFVSVIGSHLVNESRFLYAIRGISNGVSASPDAPNINISGVGSFNGNANGNRITKEKGIHIINNLSITKGRHLVKVGIDLLPVSFRERTTNINGQFTFGGLSAVAGGRAAVTPLDQFLLTEARQIDPATGQPFGYSRFTQSVGAEFFEAATFNQGYFVQDDIRMTNTLKLNLGLRYERFTRPDSNFNPALPATESFPSDSNNWAPRIAFAWDPFEQGRTVLRGGYGVYYNVVVAQTYNTFLRSNGLDVINLNVTPTTPGAPAFSRTRVDPPRGVTVVSDVRVMDPDFEDVQVHNWFATGEHELFKDYSLAVTYQGTRGTKLPISLNTNLAQAGTLPDGRRRWTTAGRPDPRFGNIFVATSVGEQQYHGLVTTLTKRFSGGYSLQAAHHLSKTTGTAFTNDFIGFGIFTTPSDPLNVDVDRGRGDFDMKHRFTITANAEPRFGGLSGMAATLLNGWQASTRLIASSGYAFDARTGQDTNGDTVFNDRPAGIPYNAFTLPSYLTLDLRLSRNIAVTTRTKVELIAEGFNLTNRLNPTNVNSNYGPGTSPSATFNQTTAAETPRQFQLAARFSF
ncbi:MAG: TonB-dependent receptor [Acidobacteria bacterium]|nr:TonB-dependent receptor [Acidobacteriota bacterium]